MKKKSCLMLAVMLAMLQIITVFAVVPASAAATNYANRDYERTYDIYKSTAEITIDGVSDDVWNNIPWSESFICASDADSESCNFAIDAKFKATWVYVDENIIDLYILLSVEGDNTVSALTTNGGDAFRMDIHHESYSSTPHHFWTGGKPIANVTALNAEVSLWYNGQSNPHYFDYAIKDNRAETGSYMIEVRRQIDTSTADDVKEETDELDIKLDMYIQDFIDAQSSSNTNARARYSWNGYYNGATTDWPQGIATFKDTAAPTDPLAGVSVTATAGASIRLDTADTTKSGIRFATTVVVPEGVEIVKTGTLIIPTATLTSNRVVDASFNKDVLNTIGLVEGTDYYDIENVGNYWVEGQEGTWYGTLYNIQSANFEREISGIGYAVVKVGDVEYTVYADYNTTDHSRSIMSAAQAALDLGIYAESSAEYALLQSFTQAEAVQQ